VILRPYLYRVAVLTAVGAALAGPAASAGAQRADSARAGARPRPPAVDTSTRPVVKPPLSPRRAFLYSLVLPGYAQSVLGRPTAGALFVLSESIGIALLRESQADLGEARRLRTDSVVVVGTDASGAPITRPSPYSDALVRVRRGHVEDWIAFLIANHLFAAADGYVGANLWDLPSQMSVNREPNGRTVLAARVSW
jgi:hypothetical protein